MDAARGPYVLTDSRRDLSIGGHHDAVKQR
jgi:hypothetical protein